MLFQSLASIYVAIECFTLFIPDIYIDTTGAAFTYPIAKYICDCRVVAYVHYPIISTVCIGINIYAFIKMAIYMIYFSFLKDMLQKVREQRPDYNNDSRIASNVQVSRMKLIYYHVFAALYSLAGRCADVVMVNSSWTK